MDGDTAPPVLLPPPASPTDLIASALHLPLASVSIAHRARKLRTTGQVLAFDPKSCLLLLGGPSTSASPTPIPTLLVNLEICLLGQQPSFSETPNSTSSTSTGYSREPEGFFTEQDTDRPRGIVSREKLRLDRGEWVTVVGWLEGQNEKIFRQVNPGSSYAAPIPLILEAIHISPSRSPPHNTIYRCQMQTWDGSITPTPTMSTVSRFLGDTSGNTVSSPIVIEDEEETPRVRRKR